MAALRWDGDERGEGIADATPFAAGALELVDAMRLATWVAEQPEIHFSLISNAPAGRFRSGSSTRARPPMAHSR